MLILFELDILETGEKTFSLELLFKSNGLFDLANELDFYFLILLPSLLDLYELIG
jgi:hypothetical protein